MKRILPLILCLLLCGCSAPIPEPVETQVLPKTLPIATFEPIHPYELQQNQPSNQKADVIRPDTKCRTEQAETPAETTINSPEDMVAPTSAQQPVEVTEVVIDEGNSPLDNDGDVWEPFFVGNSLMEGMRLNSNDGYPFQCEVGISLPSLNRKLSPPDSYNMAVIEMGTNELGAYSEQKFKEGYITLINTLNCPCYCLSIPPVNEGKSTYAARVCNENVVLYNSYIRDVCEDTGATYVDCSEFFGDTLPDKWTWDGLHLTSATYASWYEWIKEAIGLTHNALK